MPPRVDFDPVSLLRPLVAAFRLVCAVNRDKCLLEQARQFPFRASLRYR